MSGDARIPYLGGTAPQSPLGVAASRIITGEPGREPYVPEKAA
ncbi:hypothetical protein [Streptosporangium sp. 'caverna']|nr:hypothetical protein [Streptosporangium sp. 'caverna']